ncbi:hypothetical protein V9T40_001993 [Parthenolecanium corni]|uniref:Putative hydroxypyruvate isomerase n=1 Tax=Parthenolecanium corni TaxID=536013 RepID=A0AAN9TI42_9HEMI
MALRFCANLSFMFPESKSLLERYALAKKCGFSAVECAFPYDFSVHEVQNAKEKAGVEQILINVYPGKTEFGFAALPGKQSEFRDSLQKAVTYAKALDCRLIHIMAGIVESPTSEHEHTYRTNLIHASQVLQQEQMVGVIEPISSFALPNYFMNSFDKAVSYIRDINSPHLRLQVDLYHLQMMKGNLSYNLNEYLPITEHIQVAQVPDRHEPDSEGEINFCYIFKLLKELNYSGWIGCEYHPASSTQSGLDWMNTLNS